MENRTIDPWIPPQKPNSQTLNNSLSNPPIPDEKEFEPIFNGHFFVRFVHPQYKGIYNSKKEIIFEISFLKYKIIKQVNCSEVVYQLLINEKIIDLDKKKIHSPKLRFSDKPCYYLDRLLVYDNGLYGFVNYDIKVCIPLIYDFVDNFTFFNLSEVRRNGKYGYIDVNGIEKIKIKYDNFLGELNLGNYGLVRFELDGKFGIINNLNQIIVPNVFESLEKNPCFSGYLGYTKGKWKIINYDGETKDTNFEELEIYKKEKIFFSKFNDKWGVIGEGNTIILDNIFESIELFKDILILKFEESFLFTDLNGKYYIENPICEEIFDIENKQWNNLLFLKQNNLWNIFNISGKKYFEKKYDYFDAKNNFDLERGYLKVKKNSRFGIVNNDGQEIVPPIYDEILPFNKDVPTEFQLIGVKLNEKWGYINIKGEIIISLIYEEINPFEKYSIYENKYLAKVKEKSNSKIIYIDSDGNEFDEIKFINEKDDVSTKLTYKRITTIWFIYLISFYFLIISNVNISDFWGNLIVGGFFILSFLVFIIIMVYIYNFTKKIFT